MQWLDKDGNEVSLESAVWEAGKPAPLNPQAQKRLDRDVREALQDLGYRDARFEVVRQPHPETQTVDLVVRIDELGSPATLQTISVTGNQTGPPRRPSWSGSTCTPGKCLLGEDWPNWSSGCGVRGDSSSTRSRPSP